MFYFMQRKRRWGESIINQSPSLPPSTFRSRDHPYMLHSPSIPPHPVAPCLPRPSSITVLGLHTISRSPRLSTPANSLGLATFRHEGATQTIPSSLAPIARRSPAAVCKAVPTRAGPHHRTQVLRP